MSGLRSGVMSVTEILRILTLSVRQMTFPQTAPAQVLENHSYATYHPRDMCKVEALSIWSRLSKLLDQDFFSRGVEDGLPKLCLFSPKK